MLHIYDHESQTCQHNHQVHYAQYEIKHSNYIMHYKAKNIYFNKVDQSSYRLTGMNYLWYLLLCCLEESLVLK